MNLVKTSKERFLAIDANAIIHRAFHAYPSTLQTDDGIQVNAVYGFSVMLLEALRIFEPKYVFCAFDTKAPTFRHTKFCDYKATRKPTDQSLIDQFPLVEEVLKAFNIPIIKKEGFEADDILGTVSKIVEEGKWQSENLELYILSGDRDLFQLVRGDVRVCLPAGSFNNLIAYDRSKIFESFGCYPEQVVDYKALVGDASDNIPGVKGIGHKTVVELLAKYKDLDGIYKHINELKPRYQTLLAEGIEQAELSRELATIEQNMDINLYLQDCVLKDFDRKKLLDIFKRFKFKTLIPKISEIFGNDESFVVTSQLDIFSTPSVKNDIKVGEQSDFEKHLKDSLHTTIAYISEFESAESKSFYVCRFSNVNENIDMVFENIIFPKSDNITFYNWEEICFKNESVEKIDLSNCFDITLFAHLIASEKKIRNLQDIAFEYISLSIGDKLMHGDCSKILDVVEEAQESLMEKANEIVLYEYTQKSIKQYLNVNDKYLINSLRKVEMPISIILAKMERRGIATDSEYLKKLNSEIQKEIEDVQNEIYESIGHEFNISSPKQLGDVLFNELGIQAPAKKISTKESVLQDLLGYHPCIEKVLKYRELTKIHGTYTEPLLEISNSDSGNTVHTDYKQTGTTSGRLSSINPNMQNIPSQGDWAEKVRKIFIPRKGFKFIGIDYSQMELRIMADISEDKLLQQDFEQGHDIHTTTAARILDKNIEDVTKKERSVGKTVNFAILFGQTPFGLSRLLNIDRQEATSYIRSYFEAYVGVEEYVRKLEKEAFKRGFVQSMLGMTRNVPALRSKNIRARYAAQREAINMPIQGTESDIMKLAMIQIQNIIEKEYKDKAYILLQVHDELIFEAKDEIAKEFEDKVSDIMKNVVNLNVPLKLSSSIGNNLSEIK